MKLLKGSLLIIAICMMQSASAKVKRTRATPVARQTPAPRPVSVPAVITPPSAPSKTSFLYLLNRIRNNMASEFIINDQGVFGSKFENMIKSSGLAPELMEALMQAGRNLHLPLSENNEQDLELTKYAEERIGGFMESTEPRLELTQPEAPKKLQPSDIEEMLYYDKDNAMLKQDYLQRQVKELLRTKTASQETIAILQQELGPKMRRAWANNNIGMIPTRTRELNQQIKDTVMKLANPNMNLIWGEEVKEELPSGKVRPPLTKRAQEKLAQKNTPVIQLPAPKQAAEMTEESVMNYATSLGTGKFEDEIHSLYKIGATTGSALLDVNHPEFIDVVITLMKDIISVFPEIKKALMYRALQSALFIYYDTITPMEEYTRADKRIGEILDQNWDEIRK